MYKGVQKLFTQLISQTLDTNNANHYPHNHPFLPCKYLLDLALVPVLALPWTRRHPHLPRQGMPRTTRHLALVLRVCGCCSRGRGGGGGEGEGGGELMGIRARVRDTTRR